VIGDGTESADGIYWSGERVKVENQTATTNLLAPYPLAGYPRPPRINLGLIVMSGEVMSFVTEVLGVVDLRVRILLQRVHRKHPYVPGSVYLLWEIDRYRLA
jgi:hypothetical protein